MEEILFFFLETNTAGRSPSVGFTSGTVASFPLEAFDGVFAYLVSSGIVAPASKSTSEYARNFGFLVDQRAARPSVCTHVIHQPSCAGRGSSR